MKFRTLKRDFLAAFPVIGPHVGIEAEMLLAGRKPIGLFSIHDAPISIDHPSLIKQEIDRRKLDKAVERGDLISQDTNPLIPDSAHNFRLRFYGQHGMDDKIQELVQAHNTDDFENLTQDYGRYLGYRRRDVALFHGKNSLCRLFGRYEEQAHHFLNDLNNASQRALIEKTLSDLGYKNPNEYLREQLQPVSEPVLFTPDEPST